MINFEKYFIPVIEGYYTYDSNSTLNKSVPHKVQNVLSLLLKKVNNYTLPKIKIIENNTGEICKILNSTFTKIFKESEWNKIAKALNVNDPNQCNDWSFDYIEKGIENGISYIEYHFSCFSDMTEMDYVVIGQVFNSIIRKIASNEILGIETHDITEVTDYIIIVKA